MEMKPAIPFAGVMHSMNLFAVLLMSEKKERFIIFVENEVRELREKGLMEMWKRVVDSGLEIALSNEK